MRASVVEVNKLEHRVSFLATTASITPFIGLFGTVVGIIMAFEGSRRPARRTSASSRGRSPMRWSRRRSGLVAAIPAVFTTTMLTQRVKLFASEMDDFAMEFLNIAERNFT